MQTPITYGAHGITEAEVFRLLVEEIKDYSMYLLSPEGIVSTWNAGAQSIKGYAPEEIIGSHFSRFFTPEDLEAGVPAEILRTSVAMGRCETEGWRLRKDGSRFWAHVIVNAVHDESGELLGFAKITRDVTEQRAAAADLEYLANHDVLTGLPNRSTFVNSVDKWLGESTPDTTIAVIIVDLDDFKSINDTHGHSVGDAALAAYAKGLSRVLGDGIVARFGGDEFAAAIRYSDIAEVERFIQVITDTFGVAITAEGVELVTGASIGVSVYPADAEALADLLSQADLAMYRSKIERAGIPCFYDAEADAMLRARRQLATDVPHALSRGELHVVYQTQNSLATGSVIGKEALLRWEHPLAGNVSPAEFIPLAEATGAIIEIGSWVLHQACKDAAQWNKPSRVAVNVSAVQLVDPGFAETVGHALRSSGLAPEMLELEVTESAVISNKVVALQALTEISALGVTVALDDFGIGFSSIDTLITFPFDRIKIDKSLINESADSKKARAALRAILKLGEAVFASVLVEGVETEDQAQSLRADGFDEAQGFFYDVPKRLLPDGQCASDR